MTNEYQPPVLEAQLTSPVGMLLVKASAIGLTHLTVADLKHQSEQVEVCTVIELITAPCPEESKVNALQHINAVHRQLSEYFVGQRQIFELALAPKGTVFQHQVWQALAAMHFGEVCSYGEIANRIERPKAVRAVGAANGANPIAIIVPCHRVIGKNGKLTGYAYGLEMKQFLLALEARSQKPEARG
ncbi:MULTISPECIES: methylated-DNA--[protein]-cysteine S-methyltransferase [Pseudomonadati]|uniref:Methylated-DNA--protein-cysteine methyltransferase n=1 Tax=Shewanella aestuarii TaxID=1028752 RepID=A0ABT0L1R8_9GAMM|nr:methylated-DNA--[protein]-cysteine S-methyltransferase [Shewanella aestuarii]MCL1117673.1 methylated-DNA--[protein]-cysteine S-methyltransferase [Shewanella aestuarii]GGN76416.1 methylated-DNA--protein-cysteine methyltransferase [Shewanella aestuarii]